MELKGIIKRGDSVNLTCCQSINDIVIGDVSLHKALDELFDQDKDDYFGQNNEGKSPKYAVRYVILDEPPVENKSFEQQQAEVVTLILCGSYIEGCYSEWTCGYGGFDYVANDSEHSIFTELALYVGKYIHFVL